MVSTPRQRLSRGERRDELISVATELAIEQGIDRLTVRDVARSTGVAPGLIHHYFPSVDDLVIEVFRRAATADIERLHDGLDEHDARRAMLTFVERVLSPRREAVLSMWLGSWVAANRRPGLRGAVAELMDAGVRALGSIVARGVAEGVFTSDDPARGAKRILTVVDGILIQRAVRVDDVELLGLDDLIRQTVERELLVTL